MDTSSAQSAAANRLVWPFGAVVALSFIFCYAPVFIGMVGQWWAISFYSYAFLIPLISAYLVWIRRDTLFRLKPLPDYVGGSCLVAAGLSALVIGQAGGIRALQQVSLMLTVPGMVLFLFGRAVLKAVWLPVAFLWFMIPIWEVLTDALHFPFQAFSANLGVTLLRMAGIPVFQDGILIHLPNITLEVARACSGVNYLIAILATSIPLATLVLTDVRKRLILVLLAVMVSALANSVRVALIGVLAYYDLSGDLHGPYHALHGIFVSMVGYLVIFAGLWGLSNGQHESHPRPSLSADSEKRWNLEWHNIKAPWGIIATVLLLVGTAHYIDGARPVPLEQDLSQLSLVDAGWVGEDVSFIHKYQGADRSLSRVYRDVSGETVHLSVSYFEMQTQGKELVSPTTAILHSGAMRVKANLGQGGEAEVNRLLKREGGKTQLVLFWYDLNGRVVAGQYAAKLYTALEAVTHGRTNGALVSVSADLASEDLRGQERAMATLTAFASKLRPVLYQYLPHSAA